MYMDVKSFFAGVLGPLVAFHLWSDFLVSLELLMIQYFLVFFASWNIIDYSSPLFVIMWHHGKESEGQSSRHWGQGCIRAAGQNFEAHRFLVQFDSSVEAGHLWHLSRQSSACSSQDDFPYFIRSFSLKLTSGSYMASEAWIPASWKLVMFLYDHVHIKSFSLQEYTDGARQLSFWYVVTEKQNWECQSGFLEYWLCV